VGELNNYAFNAAAAVARIPGLQVVACSSLYRSEPAHLADQPEFVNSVMLVRLGESLQPLQLLAELQAIETDFGRVRHEHWGPRTLDLDIIDIQGTLSNTAELRLPHPYALLRDFVVTPLSEIAPDYVFADGQKLSRNQVEYGAVIGFDVDKSPAPPLPTTASGKLSVCSTPIGNLGDLTVRVTAALQNADAILAEDTRVARRLLSHLHIQNRVERCDENVIRTKTASIVSRVSAGQHLVFISDAGTPAVSDPGASLVAAMRAAGQLVEVLPGASAVLTALVASGFEAPAFYFGGFLPRKAGDRKALLQQLMGINAVLIFYESPHRLLAALETLMQVFPERRLCLARELTKLHEEVLIAPTSELIQKVTLRTSQGDSPTRLKGELVILVETAAKPAGGRVHQDKYAPTELS